MSLKCQILLLNRKRGKFYKGSYNSQAGLIYRGFLKPSDSFYIPDRAVPIELEKGRGSRPLWVVNSLTGCALTIEQIREQLPEAHLLGLKELKIEPKDNASCILISEKSDPETKLMLNVLCKGAFWEMLAKKLHIGLLATIIYLCAGGGIFLLGLYAIKIIFLQDSSI